MGKGRCLGKFMGEIKGGLSFSLVVQTGGVPLGLGGGGVSIVKT